MTEPKHAADPVQDPAEETAQYAVPDNPHFDEEDVSVALEQDATDGKGGAVVPKEDFVGYEDPAAEKEGDS